MEIHAPARPAGEQRSLGLVEPIDIVQEDSRRDPRWDWLLRCAHFQARADRCHLVSMHIRDARVLLFPTADFQDRDVQLRIPITSKNERPLDVKQGN